MFDLATIKTHTHETILTLHPVMGKTCGSPVISIQFEAKFKCIHTVHLKQHKVPKMLFKGIGTKITKHSKAIDIEDIIY